MLAKMKRNCEGICCKHPPGHCSELQWGLSLDHFEHDASAQQGASLFMAEMFVLCSVWWAWGECVCWFSARQSSSTHYQRWCIPLKPEGCFEKWIRQSRKDVLEYGWPGLQKLKRQDPKWSRQKWFLCHHLLNSWWYGLYRKRRRFTRNHECRGRKQDLCAFSRPPS